MPGNGLEGDEPTVIPVRMLNELVYCPRLFHIEFVQGLFADNVHTVEGSDEHERQRPKRPVDAADGEQEGLPWPAAPSKLHLGDDQRHITGVLDAIEEQDGNLVPVDYKHGSAPDGQCTPTAWEGFAIPPGAWPNDAIQVCAQAFLLEANGRPCTHGYLYYRKSKKRVRIPFEESLRRATERAIAMARTIAETDTAPAPLIDSPKCIGCSLAEVCLPDETRLLSGSTDEPPRRLVPGRDDAGVLYITGQGTQLRKAAQRIVIVSREGQRMEVPCKDIAHTAVFGNVHVTCQALAELVRDGRTVAYYTSGGWLRCVAHDFSLPNVLARVAQFAAMSDPTQRLRYARAFVAAKIHNQRVLLLRNASIDDSVRVELKDLVRRAEGCDDYQQLLGLEGRSAALYFRRFPSMVKAGLGEGYDMQGRNRRPPRDPVNAALSFGYAVLTRDVYAALVSTGLDPLVGYLHTPRPGRPALALDIMEPYRPLIVDSTVLRCLNTGELRPDHFHIFPGQALLTQQGRQAFLRAYERRMDELVRHPDFEYSISYRRALAVECRLLTKALTGDPIAYRPLRTR